MPKETKPKETKNETKSKTLQLKEKLILEPQNSGISMTKTEIDAAMKFSVGYKEFLDSCKTERESIFYAVKILKKKGFVEFDPAKKYKAGDKVYINNRDRTVLYAVIGKKPLSDGIKILASHVDCPRIDLKARPLYEEAQLAMFKTHYYGGIRKYQWVTIPLALHGVVIKKDGTPVEICIGEDDSDPVLVINDLLPHLAQEQSKRTLADGIKGEELNALVGSLPIPAPADDKTAEKVKLNVMNILHEKYGIIEADLLSADLELVPAFKARDVGFDRSMVGAYGHDDRVCAYTSFMATLDVLKPETTWVNILTDREEVGSQGATGLQSRLLEYFVHDLAEPHGISGRLVLQKSECLSADVGAAFDPTFPEVHEKRNAPYLGYGVGITKFTGSRGKSSTNEATAEYFGKVRRCLDAHNVKWQTGELGRVDLGGGGTVAMYISKLGVDVIDIGVPVLSMHAPFEIVSKLDVYNAYLAFEAFISDAK